MRVVVVGAGPAGLAAAVRASESSAAVTLIDDNPAPGGQIWRASTSPWLRKLQSSGVPVLTGARVIGADPQRKIVLLETGADRRELPYHTLILATGARELFLPFPGWTLPNVMGAGGLQALVKTGLPVNGKRVVVSGSGPLLLAVAAYLRKHGARIPVIAEQAHWKSLAAFTARLAGHPSKLWQAARLRASLGATPYLTGAWVEEAHGDSHLRVIQLRTPQGARAIPCDYLAAAYGFHPNSELAEHLGLAMHRGFARVDSWQRSSDPAIYCAGELTGLGGVDLALIEGEIAGYIAAGRARDAEALFPARAKASRFAGLLARAFALRPELRTLPDSATVVCRCEDVSFSQLKEAASWRAAKLHFRCGMGPCQGRVCGPATEFLFGWKPDSIRPPVFPARVESLVSASIKEKGNSQ